MRRRSVLAAAGAGAAALLVGGTRAEAATLSSTASAKAAAASGGDVPWASASLRNLADRVGLRIGSALYPQDIETASWAAIAGSQFSVVTPANGMKWQIVEPAQGTYDWSQADELVNFAHKNNQLIRGHCLIWHNQLPTWLTTGVANGSITKAQLMDLAHQHITTEVSRYKGKIWQWDVCNEFFTDSNPSQLDPNNWWIVNAGPEIIPNAFKWAHAADPNALLFFNDYNIGGEDGTNAKFNAVYSYVQQLLSTGVPIHGVGIQGHLDTQYGWSPTPLRQDMEKFASLGLKVAITEADVRTFVNNPTAQVPTDNLALFAHPYEYEEMLKAALAVPECISFTVWGWTDANSWVPGSFSGEGYADIYDVNQQPKAAYYALQSELGLASNGAPYRVKSYTPRS
jgi:endo-1,4-beta-xylanase